MEFLKHKSTMEASFRASLVVLLFSELTSTIGPLVDGIIISAFLGESGVKEFGIINPLLIAYNALGSVFAVGTVTLCTRLIGKGKTKEARGAFSVAFFWILGLSVVITAVLLALADPMTQMLGASPDSGEIFREARNYYLGITVSFPAINLMLYLTSFMQVDNDRGRALGLFHGRDQTAYQNCVAPLVRELPVAVSFDQIRSLEDLLNEVREQTAEGINHAEDPFILQTTSVGLNDTFRIRNQGVMRNIRGIDGIPSETVELVNKDASVGGMNIQLLEDSSGELSLCLTYSDARYLRETAEKVLELLRESILGMVKGRLFPHCNSGAAGIE